MRNRFCSMYSFGGLEWPEWRLPIKMKPQMWNVCFWETWPNCGKVSCLTTELTLIHVHIHTHPFNGPFSGTTWVSRYQKGKTNLDFTEATLIHVVMYNVIHGIYSFWGLKWCQQGHACSKTLHQQNPPVLIKLTCIMAVRWWLCCVYWCHLGRTLSETI